MRALGWVAVVVLSGCVKAWPSPGTNDERVELVLPRYPDGSEWSLSSERGKVVLIDVWATWCKPCRTSLPQYEALASRLESRGLVFYALNIDRAAPELDREIYKFKAEIGLTAPVLRDDSGAAAESVLGIQGVPTTFIIDRKGRVRHKHLGADLTTLERELEVLLAYPAPGPQ